MGNASSSSGCSDKVAARLRVDLVDRAGGSVRFKTGLRGSISGLGIGVPTLSGGGLRSLFHNGLCKSRGGVARAAMMSVTRRELGGRTGREAVDGAVAGYCECG